MKVILFQSVGNVGLPGETVSVKPGFYRNYLGPRGLAAEATPGNLKMLTLKRKKLEAEAEKIRKSSMEVSERLKDQQLNFILKAGANNRLFGSVTTADIADQLAEQGIQVDRRRISISGSIKTLGTYQARVKLQGNVQVPLTIIVKGEDLAEAPRIPTFEDLEDEAAAREKEAEG